MSLGSKGCYNLSLKNFCQLRLAQKEALALPDNKETTVNKMYLSAALAAASLIGAASLVAQTAPQSPAKSASSTFARRSLLLRKASKPLLNCKVSSPRAKQNWKI